MFLFSATLEEYWKKAYLAVFDLPEESIIVYPTAQKLRYGWDYEQQIEVSIRKTKAEAVAEMIDCICSKMLS